MLTQVQKWGIIGDGQLARMLALSAYPLGIRPILLTNDANSSAGQVCPLQVRGSLKSTTDLHALLSQVDGAVIESEFVNCDSLEATGLAHKVQPNLKVIRTLQNKLVQKQLLQELKIPTSKLYVQNEISSLWLDTLLASDHPAVVLKFATLGYDGKGVCILNQETTARPKAEAFLALANDRRIEVYAEDFVNYTQEVAMVATRALKGTFIHYPLVISEQENGVCNRVMGPASALGIQPALEISAANICKKIAEHLNLIGTFAVEFFVTGDCELLVNEIAPRVHNSGHFTLNIEGASQFTNHWQAVMGHELGSTTCPAFFAMQNILGPAGIIAKESAPVATSNKHVQVHWYGKAGISPGRKLGHLNASSQNILNKDQKLAALDSVLKQWTSATQLQIPPTNMELLK